MYNLNVFLVVGLVALLSFRSSPSEAGTAPADNQKVNKLQLGAFSVSLAVKDIAKSRAFYEKLGFKKFHGVQKQNWLIMKNGDCVIGLFQGMFKKNIMTFNPGWNQNKETLKQFTDVRDIQRSLKKSGLKLTNEADESKTGPASFVLEDPDGNSILFDQHVKKAK